MTEFEKERSTIIADTFALTDYFSDISQDIEELPVPSYMIGMDEKTYAQFVLTVDLSFKLYVLHHTETANELEKLGNLMEILYDCKLICADDQKLKLCFSGTVCQLKLAYPLIPLYDDLLIELRNFFWRIISKKRKENGANPLNLFHLSMRLNDYIAGCSLALQRCIKTISAQKERAIESHPQWDKIKPIFEMYAKELKTNPNAKFGVYFHGKQSDRLEGILREIGEWSEAQVDKETNYVESESKVSERNYKRWKANFDRWYKRNYKEGREEQFVDCFEKYLWNRVTTLDILKSMSSYIDIKEGVAGQDCIKTIRDFVLDLSQRVK